jgi:CheY-like chemotaxis protein
MMNERTGQQRHILVVDDEPLVRQTIQMLLEDDGYVVDEAESGPQALAMFEPGKFDMVFTDYFMPDMKGDQLAAAIKKRSPKQPVVMITAFPGKLTSSNCPRVVLIPSSSNLSKPILCGRRSPGSLLAETWSSPSNPTWRIGNGGREICWGFRMR